MRILDPNDPDHAEIGPAPDAIATPAQPVHAISADDLVAAFEENALAAEREFAGLVLAVTGKVGTVQRGRSDGLVVNMPASVFGTVACSFPDIAFDELAALRRGDAVFIEGAFSLGKSLTVRLRGCRIVSAREPVVESE